MSGSSRLSGGNRRRGARRRPGPPEDQRWPWAGLGAAALAIAVGLTALVVVMLGSAPGRSGGRSARTHTAHAVTSAPAAPAAPGAPEAASRAAPVASGGPAVPADYGVAPAPPNERVTFRLRAPLSSGMLFDVRTGRVLWDRAADRVLPIASLTKMMTALIVAEVERPNERVLITRAAVAFQGSGVGLLPLDKWVRLETLLYGLMLPSGNDAAIALAEHVAGTQSRFISMMNARVQAMGLGCTHFTTVSGIVDDGNYSCVADLAKLARAVLDVPRLARIVGTASAAFPFPIKHGRLYLYNNNPLYRIGYPGTDGVKTGYTAAAGVCLVATARRGGTWLGVVLLHSADEIDQATGLLDAGFAAMRRAQAAAPSVTAPPA